MDFAAVIVAAGSGTRAGAGVAKQWRLLAGQAVLRWSAQVLLKAGAKQLIVVIRRGDEALAQDALKGLDRWTTVLGGETRAASVRAGLGLVHDVDAVLIHDAARPFVSKTHVELLLTALVGAEGALPALPVADTLKVDRAEGLATAPRDGLWRAQTPQAFRLEAIRRAYAALPATTEPTDDAQVLELAGGRMARVPGDARLFKLTHPEDFDLAEAFAAAARSVRIGQGYDAHRFGPGASVWLCGVEIAHDHGLIGHSDADAGLHAVTDAVLGAIGAGDIGDHFPPSDPKWRGAPSDIFLRHAVCLVTARGGRIANVDVTLVCEQPKIKPHRAAMRERLAGILGVETDRVSIKATTTEGMGFTGRGEGLAAQAIAAVEL
jgi:2-C-methyl-D-erythritol 4-phosphate cytidylyltransferase / 2-C-methyl-D-erythritol 2,4-cyclodiphosphate synthase